MTSAYLKEHPSKLKTISLLISYLKYFYFIGKNWNYRLAFFTLIQEIKGEKKYHVDTIDIDLLKTLSVKGDHKKNASIYQGANYFLLEKAFTYLQEEANDGSFVDFGCGKGRTLVVAAHFGFKEIKGIEFAPALCAKANENINHISAFYPGINFSIICEDAVTYQVNKTDKVFFFFNPFDERVMLPVVKNILQSLREFPREIFVIYINPLHKEIFLSAGFSEEYYLEKLKYLELSILSFISPHE